MSSKTAKKFKVRIKWFLDAHHDLGDDEWNDGEVKERTYDFKTERERDAFLQGVEQAVGWSEYEVLKNKEYDNE